MRSNRPYSWGFMGALAFAGSIWALGALGGCVQSDVQAVTERTNEASRGFEAACLKAGGVPYITVVHYDRHERRCFGVLGGES